MSIRRTEVEVLAWKLHNCPDGYEGPCWGPTATDRDEARRLLTERQETRSGSSSEHTA